MKSFLEIIRKTGVEICNGMAHALEQTFEFMFSDERDALIDKDLRKLSKADFRLYVDAIHELRKDNDDFSKTKSVTLSTGETWEICSGPGIFIINNPKKETWKPN